MPNLGKKLLILFFLLALCATASAFRNPEEPFKKLKECEEKCFQKQDERERSECHQTCYREFQERERKEKEEREREEGRREGGGGSNPEDPFKKLRECEGKCLQKQDEREKSQCHQTCYREFEEREREEREREERGGGGRLYFNPRQEEGEREEQSEREHKSEPYVFQDKHYSTKHQTDHGSIRILQRFNEKSELLRGIENYRVAILEANPQTFIVPNHWDADTVIFVHQGRGIISFIRQDKRESFNIRRGDVLRVQAGTTVYMVNHDNNEKLVLVKLVRPVFTPGKFEAFFGPGGQNPESFFRVFSSELLEAAFNKKRDKFEKIFQQQSEGVIIKASEEQIKALSRHEEGGIWPFGSESKCPCNLFKRPSRWNQYGKLYELDPSECKDLRELDLGVSFANLSRGSMTAPMYNSRATRIAIVVNGKGYLEIVCPHLSSSGGQQGGKQRQTTVKYQRVSSHLQCGTVFVVPAGHPFITVASQNENLQLVSFDVKGLNNDDFQLAGKKNIFNQFEKAAKELAFGVSEKEVDEVFKSQEDEFFLKGPQQQREGRAYA